MATVLVVPGAFYAEHAHTGADGQRVLDLAASLGCPAERVPVGSFDPTEVNARVLLTALSRHRGPVVVVSLSKGSADVSAALAIDPAAFARVGAWVSLSGLLAGSPLVDWIARRRLRSLAVRAALWWRGHPRRTMLELSPATCRWPNLPPHLRLVRVVGFPQRRHLCHRWAPRAYDRLAPLVGPNDGGGLALAEALDGPGLVCPVWAADHYLQPTAFDLTPVLRAVLADAVHRAATV